MTIDEQIDELQALAAQVDCVIWDIHFCNAGIGIIWHDERRCVTPIYKPTEGDPDFVRQMNLYSESMNARSKEGRIVYRYYTTLSECLKAEKERIEKELMEINK